MRILDVDLIIAITPCVVGVAGQVIDDDNDVNSHRNFIRGQIV